MLRTLGFWQVADAECTERNKWRATASSVSQIKSLSPGG
jgi:hypothetical protein